MLYLRGSLGPEVARIQGRLAQLGWYLGPVEGVFGGGTESAVAAFQRAEGIVASGGVDGVTWARLFPGEALPSPEIAAAPLPERCLALTGSFETDCAAPECFARLSGDFDGQGISFGVLQWNLGQGTLQRLLRGIDTGHPLLFDEVFHTHAAALRAMLAEPREQQLEWARSVQDAGHRLHEPWRGLFKSLGRRPESQRAQAAAAELVFADARAMCADYDLSSERGLALMFDVKAQNGGIRSATRDKILTLIAAIPAADLGWPDLEVRRLRVVAELRSAAAKPKYRADVLARILTIANGEGEVHGRHYNLTEQYGLHLRPIV